MFITAKRLYSDLRERGIAVNDFHFAWIIENSSRYIKAEARFSDMPLSSCLHIGSLNYASFQIYPRKHIGCDHICDTVGHLQPDRWFFFSSSEDRTTLFLIPVHSQVVVKKEE